MSLKTAHSISRRCRCPPARPAFLCRAAVTELPHRRRGLATAATATSPSPSAEPESQAQRPAHFEPHPVSPPSKSRLDRLRAQLAAEPEFSPYLTDSFARQHNYLRISLTQRCNLRCTYCMPAEGVELAPEATQLTTPEIVQLAGAFVGEGVRKIRLTGGEPSVRRDFADVVQQLGKMKKGRAGLEELCLTTNGLALRNKLPLLQEAGVTGINLSLDTLDPHLFQLITRRPGLDKVRATLDRVVEMNGAVGGGSGTEGRMTLKLNCVLVRGVNDRELLDFVELAKEKDLEVRFIEYMPFDGNKWERRKVVPYAEMLETIRAKYPEVQKVPDPSGNETGKTWQIPGFKGRIGFITSMTQNFCAGCNRIRVTSDGNLKVCLFGEEEVSLRDVLREANGGKPVGWEQLAAMREERGLGDAVDQYVWAGDEATRQKLREVVGAALGQKKARHAGMGQIENMKNRPMILIDRAAAKNPFLTNPPPSLFSRNTIPPSPSSFHQLQTRHFSSTRTARTAAKPPPKNPNHLTPYPRHSKTKPLPFPSTAYPPPHPLPHLSPTTSEMHIVPISPKTPTYRTALAVGAVAFSAPPALHAVRTASLKKGDVLATSRLAGIQAAKRTPDIVPLCHSGVSLEGVRVWVQPVESEARSAEPERGGVGGTGYGEVKRRGNGGRRLGSGFWGERRERGRGEEALEEEKELPDEMLPQPPADGHVPPSQVPSVRHHPAREPQHTTAAVAAARGETVAAAEADEEDPDPALTAYLARGIGEHGGMRLAAWVSCTAKTGVEMEALCAVAGAGLSVVDMVKAVDKECEIDEVKVVRKEGGRSGRWKAEGW